MLSLGAIIWAPGVHYGGPGGHFEGLGVHFVDPGGRCCYLAGRSLHSRCPFFDAGAIIKRLEFVRGQPGVMILMLGAEVWGAGRDDGILGRDDGVPGGAML